MGILKDIINSFFKMDGTIRKKSEATSQKKAEKDKWEFKYNMSPIVTILLFLLVIGIINILIYLFYNI